MNYIEDARKLRPIVERAMQSIDGNDAVAAVCLYPEWLEDAAYEVGYKVQFGGKLWRTLQAHTSQAGWEPEVATSLWEEINEIHAGTLDDPIPYSGNIALILGLHYMQYGIVYQCIRDTVNPVYNTLSDLVGIYVEAVDANGR